MGSLDTIRMICPNEKCINKSPVFRKFDLLKEHTCKKCKTPLVKVKSKLAMKQDQKAKRELRDYDESL